MEEDKRKEKRVGTYTFGAMMILIGISVIIMTFTKLDFVRYILMLWPVILILFGVEIIYLNSKSNIKVKIDFASIILMCAVLFFTGIFSVGNYFVNKLLYDDNVKNLIVSKYIDTEYSNIMNKEINIQTEEKDKVKVKIIEDKQEKKYTNSSFVKIKLDVDETKDIEIKDIINLKNDFYDEFANSNVTIKKLPEYIKEIQVTVYTRDANNVKYDGTIIK